VLEFKKKAGILARVAFWKSAWFVAQFKLLAAHPKIEAEAFLTVFGASAIQDPLKLISHQ